MKFLIQPQSKSAMQSGKKNTKKWLMTLIEENNSRAITPTMGWVGSNNTNTQLQFHFSNKEQAIAFANSKGFEYVVIDQKKSSITPKSYASNFLQ